MEECGKARVGQVQCGIDTLTPPKPQSQVEGQTDLLNATVMSVEDSIIRLRDRLETVLRAQPPGSDCEEQARGELVPHADQLREIRERSSRSNEMLNDILDRIEL